MANLVPKFCDKCGTKHTRSDLTIMDHAEEKIVCKLQCNSCNNMYMIHVHNTAEGMVAKRSNVRSEISQTEYQKFATSEAIDPEEILDVFIALEEVDSIKDLENLLKE